MAVAGISPEGKARGGDQPGIWLTPPPSPGPHGTHRVRSSYHTPSPRLLHYHDKGTSSLSTSNNNLTKEPLAQRHSTGDLAMARDPSAAFYKSLTKPKPREPMIPKTNRTQREQAGDDVKGSADSLVAQVRVKLAQANVQRQYTTAAAANTKLMVIVTFFSFFFFFFLFIFCLKNGGRCLRQFYFVEVTH